MKKTILRTIMSALLSCCFFLSSAAYAAVIGNTQITSKGACVMDYETGRVLYEYNGNTALVPASMTKLMTMYCIYDAINAGEISYDTIVPISANVSGLGAKDPGLTVLPLKADTQYTVDELINMIVVFSANDAALAIAELLEGSEANFVARMNEKAEDMGLDAHFYDCYGLANNEITPVSMAELSRRLISDYPDIIIRSRQTTVNFHGGTYKTTNHLLDTFYYSGADGLKTGTTTAAGCCFCGTAVRDNVRMIAVTMGSAGTDDRFIDVARMLDYGFAIKQELFSKLYFTNIRTIIDDMQVPTLYHKGDMTPVIIAEDLGNYGFDVEFNDDTLTITRHPGKKMSPIDTSYYRNKDGETAYDIIDGKITNVILRDGAVTHKFNTVYSLNGYTGITTDEFSSIYETDWIDKTSTVNINTSNKVDCLLSVFTDDFEEIDFSDDQPMLSDGETMIPVRPAAEALGASIDWSDASQAYVIDCGTCQTAITPDSLDATENIQFNTHEELLPDAPQVINGKLCMTVDCFAYIMNLNVVFDKGTRTVLLKSNDSCPFLHAKTAAAQFSAPLPNLSL